MRLLRDNLLVQFSVTSFIILALIALILATVLSNRVRDAAVGDLVDEAVGTSSGRLISALTPEDFEVPMTGARYDRFHRFVQESVVSDRTARVKLWDRDGTVIYSNDPGGVGERFPGNENVRKALDLDTAVEIDVPQDAENARERDLGTLMEVYAPVIFPGSSEPAGVFEIYQYYGPTAQLIRGINIWIFGSIGVGFLLLYGGLVSIVWRGWRTITFQRGQLQLANTRLEATIGELRETNSNLERSNRELEEFASVAAHDLQEPLRKVQSFGDRLEAKCGPLLTDQGKDYLARMQNAAGRMRSLIDDLLAFSRVTSRAQPFAPVDLAETVQEVVSDLEVRVEQVGARVQVGDLATIEADPVQMRLLFQNLISNALKFHRPEVLPEVSIQGEYLDSHSPDGAGNSGPGRLYQLTVADNGIGFDEKFLSRLFTIFHRLHGVGEYDGNGVGLAICRKIAERHGGSITATGKPNEGATFIVTLPAKQDIGEVADAQPEEMSFHSDGRR